MAFIEKSIFYFESPGPHNSEDAARFSISRAQELGLSTVVVASTTGATAMKFAAAIKGTGLRLVVVTHVVGFTTPGKWEFNDGDGRPPEEGGCDYRDRHARACPASSGRFRVLRK